MTGANETGKIEARNINRSSRSFREEESENIPKYNKPSGVAVHPRHLSLWERLRGDGKSYNPEIDYKQRIEEFRKDWEETQKETVRQDNNSNDRHAHYSPEVHQYFVRTSGNTSVDSGSRLAKTPSNEKN